MTPLDSDFFSDETNAPFCHCAACQIPLLEIDRPWLVTKEFHGRECTQEYAICEPCRNLLTARIPEPTKMRIRAFLESEIDWETRVQELLASHDRLANCIVCRTSRNELPGYTLSAAFDSSGYLIEGPLPLMMCPQCCGRMRSLLCEEGLRVWEEFCETHLRHHDADGSGPMFW